MKKIISVMIAAIALTASTFAFDFVVSGGVAFPFQFTTSTDNLKVGSLSSNTITTKNTTSGFGIDAEADVFFTKLLGVGVDLGMEWPSSVSTKVTASTNTLGVTGSTTNSDSIKLNGENFSTFNFNCLIGPAIRPLNTKKMFFIVIPGIDFNVQATKAKDSKIDSKTTTSSWGIGANARFGYKVTKNIAIDAAVLFSWDFSSTIKAEAGKSSTSESAPAAVILTPKIGASFIL